jgi:hypothetical protein
MEALKDSNRQDDVECWRVLTGYQNQVVDPKAELGISSV